LLAEELPHGLFLPKSVDEAVRNINGLIAESEKSARAFLRRFSYPEGKHFSSIPLKTLNEHTKPEEIDELLQPLLKNETWGLISDCGLPCLADPGAGLVRRAREKGIQIKAFVGPSSITLALMLSGLPAQCFAFHGYLEREEEPLKLKIRALEKRSQQENETELFIEAPYRNQKLLTRLVETLNEKTLLCVAWDLTLPTEGVITQRVSFWRKNPLPDLAKKPAIFLFKM
jgi:16S rRNA (cytidine1402-2'-O)-methyltransferase